MQQAEGNSTEVDQSADELGSFTDRRVFLVRSGDKRVAALMNGVYHWQSCDGPTFLIIPPDAPTDKCHRAASRFGLDAAAVISFRDSDRLQEQALTASEAAS